MKKMLALAALAAAFSISVPASAAGTGCGSNVKRDAVTRAPPASSSGVRSNDPGVGTKRN
jgi:hypothetical protein